ncbi:hypothetical protein PCANC_15901 [Puccinia coronata f. sp. avenae]|uniref:Uncharacterized protein n=1 Tax=Puccinia coronata f. sp. avenae TaxID=200324 RepID=A0A2N5UMC3_9BASI|nr:hypothetical protein PCANC_15901 [Puccinia coronata f. sp. avenae]
MSEDNVVIKENHLPAAGQALTRFLVPGGGVPGGVTRIPGRKQVVDITLAILEYPLGTYHMTHMSSSHPIDINTTSTDPPIQRGLNPPTQQLFNNSSPT